MTIDSSTNQWRIGHLGDPQTHCDLQHCVRLHDLYRTTGVCDCATWEPSSHLHLQSTTSVHHCSSQCPSQVSHHGRPSSEPCDIWCSQDRHHTSGTSARVYNHDRPNFHPQGTGHHCPCAACDKHYGPGQVAVDFFWTHICEDFLRDWVDMQCVCN